VFLIELSKILTNSTFLNHFLPSGTAIELFLLLITQMEARTVVRVRVRRIIVHIHREQASTIGTIPVATVFQDANQKIQPSI